MDDVYHGYQCGDDCPVCHPDTRMRFFDFVRWKPWDIMPGWEFRAEPSSRGAIILARPMELTKGRNID